MVTVLTKEQVNSLIAFLLTKKVPRICDGTLKNTQTWIRSNIHGDLHEAISNEFINRGINCDCDVLMDGYQNCIEYAADYQNSDGSFGRETFGMNIPYFNFYKRDIIYKYFIDKYEKPGYKLLSISLSGSPAKDPEKLLEQYEKEQKEKATIEKHKAKLKIQRGKGEIEDKRLLELLIKEELIKQNTIATTLNALLIKQSLASEYLSMGEECLAQGSQPRQTLTITVNKNGTCNLHNCCLDLVFEECFKLVYLPHIIKNQIKLIMKSNDYQLVRQSYLNAKLNSDEQAQSIENLKTLIQQYNLTKSFCREQIKKRIKATSNKSGKLVLDLNTEFYLKIISEKIYCMFEKNELYCIPEFLDLISIIRKNNKKGIQIKGDSLLFDNYEFKVLLPENELQIQKIINKTKYCRLKREWINSEWEYSVDLIY